jgi:hypothetical protein
MEVEGSVTAFGGIKVLQNGGDIQSKNGMIVCS